MIGFTHIYHDSSGDEQTDTYFYLKNAQGDIAGITDFSGNIVAEYVYDSWGKVLHVLDATGTEITDSDNIAHINPLRYRGYYYDSKFGFYYLNTRYYDPETGRFLNADDNFEDGTNLFEYCSNDPVSFVDPDGSTKEDAVEYAKKNPRPVYNILDVFGQKQFQAKLDAWNKGMKEALNKPAPAPAAQSGSAPTATNTTATEKPKITYVSQISKKSGYVADNWKNKLKIGPKEGCAVASVSMALSSLGITKTPGSIIDAQGGISVVWSKHGTCDTTVDLATALKRYNDDPQKYAPPIAKVGNPHWAIVISEKDGVYTTMDPAYGENKTYTLKKNTIIKQYYKK